MTPHNPAKTKVRLANKQLQGLGAKILRLIDSVPHLQDPLDYALGALHAFMLAKAFRFSNREFSLAYARRPKYKEILLARATDMSRGTVRVDGKWAAGFYFNSGVVRLDASFERAQGMLKRHLRRSKRPTDIAILGRRPRKLRQIRREVNKLKHIPTGTLHRRRVRFNDAVRALREFLNWCDQAKAEFNGNPVCK